MGKYLPPVLETERLILRPLTLEDKPAIYKWASDPEVAKFMRYSIYKSPEDADFWLNNIYVDEKQLDYGFVLKETGELIGSGGFIYNPENEEWDIGYNLRRDMWGKGLVPEACRKMIEYIKDSFGAKKIGGNFAVGNEKSGRVMEKLGMKYVCDTEYSKFDGSESFKAKHYSMDI